MKLRILPHLDADTSLIKPISIRVGVDAVIVVGDVCEGTVRRIVPMAILIPMAAGNHEFHRGFIPDELSFARIGPQVQHASAGEQHVRAERRLLRRSIVGRGVQPLRRAPRHDRGNDRIGT
jgi:hypothetical protein